MVVILLGTKQEKGVRGWLGLWHLPGHITLLGDAGRRGVGRLKQWTELDTSGGGEVTVLTTGCRSRVHTTPHVRLKQWTELDTSGGRRGGHRADHRMKISCPHHATRQTQTVDRTGH
ncbi:hypothetical protein RRG08_052888 [Elysia crispata]|uniref:Uncharacterized protein n=1 Tax=Elysia crispata TaxID=231223 RepID=A0AAE1DF95_9GAST|nr:hypothetical protein RRG08_052888 [Elysia crispata]